MERMNLYVNPHKGVRAALVQAASLAARTDFGNRVEAEEAARTASKLVEFLETHARHEDRELMPILARVAPELHARLRDEHERTDGLQRGLAGVAEQLRGAADAERPALGHDLHARLWRLTAEHLLHLEREESEAMRALWEHCSDEDLNAAQARMVAATPPAALAEWAAVMLPAMSLPERTALLAPMVQKLPRPAFEALIGPTRTALGDRWSETASAIGL